METIIVALPELKRNIIVELDRKKMKTCRLKVYPNQRVVLAIPHSVPINWAERFLKEKSKWIERKLKSFQETMGYAATTEIKNGYSIKLLGEDMIFVLSRYDKDLVLTEGKKIYIYCRTPEDQEKVEKWWRKQAKCIIEERVKYWYPIIEKYNMEFPRISIRKMKTLWGSCSVERQVITFNFYLIKARIPYIDYVVLHELVHFLYPNHGKCFYDFLSNYMPDWKERKRVLDRDVVHGI